MGTTMGRILDAPANRYAAVAASLDRPPLRILGRTVGFALLVAIVFGWSYRALHDPGTNDAGLAWNGGVAAWNTGHPENVFSWIGMPFLGMLVAFVSRFESAYVFAKTVTVLNTMIVVAGGGYLLWRLWGRVRPWAWWVVAIFGLGFGPIMSSVWWKQFNIMALALAIVGFMLIRGDKVRSGALLIGLSVALKPLAILLPFVLIARRGTRWAGIQAVVWIVVLNVAAMIMFAVAAHSLSPLDPFKSLHNFDSKTWHWACDTQNFAPGSTMCMIGGGLLFGSQTLTNVASYVTIIIFGLWSIEALRGRGACDWELLAFTLPLSVMIGPIAWTHYQIALAPLFVLLLLRFANKGASPAQWVGLLLAFLLASIIWQPYGTLTGEIHTILSGSNHEQSSLSSSLGIAPYAQYVLLITGILWYERRKLLGDADRQSAERADGPVGAGGRDAPELGRVQVSGN